MNVNTKNLINYAIMAFPLSFAGMPIYIYAPDFYSATLGVSLASIGTVLLFLRIIDAVQDPLIGYLSDKFSSYSKITFSIGTISLGLGFYMLFNPPENDFKVIWFAFSVLLATTGFSILTINLNALGGIWSDNYNDKTKISATREAFSLIGLMLAAALPTYLTTDFGEIQGFQYYSIIMLAILFASFVIFKFFWLNNFDRRDNTEFDTSFSNIFKPIKANKSFFIVYFFSVFASSIPAILIVFFVRDRLKLEDSLGIFLISYFLAAASSMPIWHKISKSKSKLFAWQASMLLAIITFIWAFFLNEKAFYQYLVICITSGIAFGAELSLPPSILADKVQKNSVTSEYSVLTFLLKSGLAIAAGSILPILENIGYQPGESNPSNILTYLSFCYALLPCVLKALAVILLIIFYKEIAKQNKSS